MLLRQSARVKKCIANVRTGHFIKTIETDLATNDSITRILFQPDNADNCFAIFDAGKKVYDIHYTIINVQPRKEHLW